MGVIPQVNTDKDGRVSMVTIRTLSENVVRALNRICPFPEEGEDAFLTASEFKGGWMYSPVSGPVLSGSATWKRSQLAPSLPK